MRKVMYKWFWAWNFDKEEQWLNEMASKGLALVAVGFCKYTFEECVPCEYKVRLEYLKSSPTSAESQQYIRFIEETGAEHLGSVTGWVFFRKKTDCGEFDLYSDNTSKIQQLNRLLVLTAIISPANIVIALSNIRLYYSYGNQTNLSCGLINLSLGLLIAYGFSKVFLKKKKMQKQMTLFE